ncbi:DUF72 domain-containing protein, partial [candidate division KSB1 bacterium]|nr:DUF72 domain-containing protein [candidate division KSB1 bacterium]
NSFYKLPEKKTLKTWFDTVPDNFLFTFKANRYITHMKKLKDPEKPVANLYDRTEILQNKLGPVLFQLPPRWKFNEDRLRSFLKTLSDNYQYTFEFRDESWWNDTTYQLLKEHNVAFCIFELAGRQSPREVTTDFIYIRLHGPGDAYQGEYDNQTLSGWAGAFHAWKDAGKQVYCYFDNDQNGYAANDAMKLKNMITP